MPMTAKIHALQAARAVAAWLVIADHAILETTHNAPADPATHAAWTVGSTGVYAFFVLSGFIMVYISWDEFGRPGAAARFLTRRLVRIVPLYWIATLCALAYHRVSATHGAHAGWAELGLSLAFIPYAGDGNSWTPILPQGWTLSYEMVFYAIFAASLHLSRRVALPLVGITLAAFVGLGLGSGLPQGSLTVLASPIVLWFVLGMCLGAAWRFNALREPRWLGRTAQYLEPFGDASYSTYLSHGIVLTLILRTFAIGGSGPGIWIVPISLVVATLVGLSVHVLVERPLLRTIDRVIRAPGMRLLQTNP
jgi:peptidoglycan/LPS O-acetylase OafA/YrhL